jgi:tetratricopeptide (TPR) repeat protein
VFALLNFEMVRAGIVAGSVNEEFIANHRELIADTGKRLEGLAQSTNKTTALAALRRLTVVNLLHRGFDGQIEVYRRMLRLDPSGEFGWDGLIAMYAALDRHPELIKACEQRVKAKDTPRNRLLLAKAYEAAGEWEKVEPQVRKSLELDPDYAAANLCLAVVLLKQSKLEEANAFLGKAHRSETTDPDHVHQLPYVQGLYWGLKGMRFMAQLELSKATNASEKAETALAIIQGR